MLLPQPPPPQLPVPPLPLQLPMLPMPPLRSLPPSIGACHLHNALCQLWRCHCPHTWHHHLLGSILVLELLKPQNAAEKMMMPSVRAMAPPQLAQGIVQVASDDGGRE